MRKKLKLLLWVSLILSLFPMFPGVKIRLENESRNKSVVLAADFSSFAKTSSEAQITMDKTLELLRGSGVKTIAIGEDINGFDERLLKELKSKGFDIILRPGNTLSGKNRYFVHLESMVKDYKVKYIIFNGTEATGFPSELDKMEGVIKRNGLTVGLIEDEPDQIRYFEQSGLEDLIPAIDYSINRVFITPESQLSNLSSEDLLFRWIRGVVDRNIRIVYIEPLRAPHSAPLQDITHTLQAVKSFAGFIDSKGFSTSGELPRLSSLKPSASHSFWILLSLLIAVLVYLAYMFQNNFKFENSFKFDETLLIPSIPTASAVLVQYIFGIDLSQFYALAAAVLYPALSSLLVIKWLTGNSYKPFIVRLFCSLLIFLTVNGIGGYTISACFPDISSMMNLKIFLGVPLAYTLPLLLFAAAYSAASRDSMRLKGNLNVFLRRRPTFNSVLILLACTFILYLYLARSGNHSLIPASTAELEVRKFLEALLMARPRFKEILIGYPSLFALVFLFNGRKSPGLFPLGLGMTVGAISIVNSFCHVFTPVEISALRTFNGLLLGAVSGIVPVLLLAFFNKKTRPT